MIASFLPFGVWNAICECWLKYKARRSKDMEILGPLAQQFGMLDILNVSQGHPSLGWAVE
jgi:hypothetical protein